jgi:hypothetical protein
MILFTPGTRCPRLNVIRKLRDRIDVSTGSGMAKPKLERWQATYAEGNSTHPASRMRGDRFLPCAVPGHSSLPCTSWQKVKSDLASRPFARLLLAIRARLATQDGRVGRPDEGRSRHSCNRLSTCPTAVCWMPARCKSDRSRRPCHRGPAHDKPHRSPQEGLCSASPRFPERILQMIGKAHSHAARRASC